MTLKLHNTLISGTIALSLISATSLVNASASESPSLEGPALAIRDCNLVCDGETNDAPALNACLEKHKHVILPVNRTCAVRATHASRYLAVHLPSGGVLEGSGPSSILRVLPVIMADGSLRTSRGVGAIADSANTPKQGMTVKNLAISSEIPRLSSEQGHGVFFYGRYSDIRIQDITILRATNGDGVYLGQDVSYATVRDVYAIDVARNAVTVEGETTNGIRPGIRIMSVTRSYTDASDPNQRGGRLVDVETSGDGLSGLVVIGNTGPGGIEIGSVDQGIIVGNAAQRIHTANATNMIIANNSLQSEREQPSLNAQREFSGIFADNWVRKTWTPVPGGTHSIVSIENNALTDGILQNNRLIGGNITAPVSIIRSENIHTP